MLVAPRFAKKLSDSFVRQFQGRNPQWGPVGYVTYKRTYARMRPEGVTEEWFQTIERGVNGILEIGGVYSQDEAEQLYFYWFSLKGTLAGRPTWQLGTDTVRKVGGDSMQNCWHVAVDNPIDPFTFAFNELMLGGGVGFNVTPELVYSLPPVKYAPVISRVDDFDCDYIVTDNREGWVLLLEKVLQAHFFTGKPLRYDTRCVRARGRPIRGFGGTASGPEELVKGIAQICTILNSKVGRKLTPTNCMDIMNIIGSIVVAGNVRRSAEIAVGSWQDPEFMGAKDWTRRAVPPWRQMSNNTVDCPDTMLLPEEFWRGYRGEGEAYGLYNSNLSKQMGRLIDGYGYRPDPLVIGPNPCGEIILESHEACNLSDIFLPNITDVHEFGMVASLLFKANKAISCLPCWHPKTQEVVNRNHRIGVGVTGFLQAPHLHDADIFDAVYAHLEDTDKHISREMGCNRSIKLTTVKPSGTMSLLAGVSPGVHAEYAEYYIRRITFASEDPIVQSARDRGYTVEPKYNIDGSRDFNTMVIDFPCKSRDNSIIAKGYPASKQLENLNFLQTYWSDNAVSMTCYMEEDEIPEVQDWLKENYADTVKTASFSQHSRHGFVQAPYQEITQDQYLELSYPLKPITHIVDHELREIIDSADCLTGGCPIK